MKKKIIADEDSDPLDSKSRKAANEQYQCGDETCGKVYHSYTAFYNHCKKSHEGEFPKNSLLNDRPFEGPTKNRGRPRIKKNEAKDLIQIESMKKENELIEFLGTLKTKKAEQLIVYVESPVERVEAACIQIRQWLRERGELSEESSEYLGNLLNFNSVISENDLPEFYDPIETDLYPDKMDSYNFGSIYSFMTRTDMREKFGIKFEGRELLFKIFLCWLARILSQKLYDEVLFAIMQFESQLHTNPENFSKNAPLLEKELLFERGNLLKKMVMSFFDCFMKEHEGRPKERKLPHLNDKHFAEDD